MEKNKDLPKLNMTPKVTLTDIQKLCEALVGRTRKKPQNLTEAQGRIWGCVLVVSL